MCCASQAILQAFRKAVRLHPRPIQLLPLLRRPHHPRLRKCTDSAACMKLTARDIAGFLKNPARGVQAVLLYGPDQGLVRERSRQIAKTILGEKSDPLNHIEFSGDRIKSDPPLLCDELSAMSLMGGQRLVTVSGADDKLAAIIADAYQGLSTTTYLIVEAGELGASAGLRALFEKESSFAALPCYRDEGRGLEDVIRSHLAQHQLRASSDALHYLSAHLGNDRGITISEIDKIALYLGEQKELSLETAMLLCGHNASESIEDICHAVTSGDVKNSHALLARLLYEGVQPVAILRSLLKHVQRLDIAQARIQGGMSADAAIEALRPKVFFKYTPLFKRELSRLGPRALAQMLSLLLRTEKELKSSLLSPSLLISQALQQATRMAA